MARLLGLCLLVALLACPIKPASCQEEKVKAAAERPLDEQIRQAISYQRRRSRNGTMTVESQIIEAAPKAVLASGTADISTTGEEGEGGSRVVLPGAGQGATLAAGQGTADRFELLWRRRPAEAHVVAGTGSMPLQLTAARGSCRVWRQLARHGGCRAAAAALVCHTLSTHHPSHFRHIALLSIHNQSAWHGKPAAKQLWQPQSLAMCFPWVLSAPAAGHSRVTPGPTLLAYFTLYFSCSWRAGECEADIDELCEDVEPGEGRLAECLLKQMREEAKGNIQGPGGILAGYPSPCMEFIHPL